jgi:hypothetical protein
MASFIAVKSSMAAMVQTEGGLSGDFGNGQRRNWSAMGGNFTNLCVQQGKAWRAGWEMQRRWKELIQSGLGEKMVCSRGRRNWHREEKLDAGEEKKWDGICFCSVRREEIDPILGVSKKRGKL